MSRCIRRIKEEEYPLLEDFLYLAIHQTGSQPLPRSIVRQGRIASYIKGFGTQAGDLCLVAQEGAQVVGAIWSRIIEDGYGHLDAQTPELAISVKSEYRNRGIGTSLIKELCTALKQEGFSQVSLSVAKDNEARLLYQRCGFVIQQEQDEDFILVRTLMS